LYYTIKRTRPRSTLFPYTTLFRSQEQGQLQQERADMEDQEIGDGEADDEREGPHDDGVLERVCIQRIGQAGPEQLEVVGEDERRDDVELVEVEEADGHDQRQRYPEEHQQQACQGRHEEMVAAPRPRHVTPRRTRSTYEPCSGSRPSAYSSRRPCPCAPRRHRRRAPDPPSP